MKYSSLKIGLLLILLIKICNAQVVVHKHYTTEDGLINNFVLRIMEDSKGFMWFATKAGISKWDGRNFENISMSDGLTSPAIIDFIESSDSIIYLSNYRKGITLYKDGIIDTIDTEDGLSSDFVIRIRLNKGNPIFISDKVQEYRNGELHTYESNFNLKERTGDVLFQKDRLYASSRYGGFYASDEYTDEVFYADDGLIGDNVDLFEQDSSGNILIATFRGPNKYSKGKIHQLKYQGTAVKGVVTDVLVGKDGTNYFATDNGLVIEKNNKVNILTTENGLLGNTIFSLEEDRNGAIYIGYEDHGFSIYYPDRITNFFSETNPQESIANAFIQGEDSTIILGTDDGILLISEDELKRPSINNNLSNKKILSLERNSNNDILIGTYKGFDILKNGRIVYAKNIVDSYYQEINDIEISPYGDKILAIRRNGLQIISDRKETRNKFIDDIYKSSLAENGINSTSFRDSKIISLGIDNGLLSNWILDLLVSKDSTLIIGYHGRGVSFLKNGRFWHLSKRDGLTDNIVTTILETSKGEYWFGTSVGGITILKNGGFDTLDVEDGLSSNDIRGIVEVEGKIYVTTQRGLNIIIPYPSGNIIRMIDKNDGLASNECNPKALFVDNNENIWIGTSNGVTKYNPSADKPITDPPKTFVTRLEIFNKPFPLQTLQSDNGLKYDQNYLKFFYSCVNLSSHEKIKYKYRLIGVDPDWIESSSDNVQYTSLDDGEHIFEIKARNEWGYWSAPSQLAFTINPAWWETWWFRLGVISLLGFLLWLAFQYRLNYLLKLERLRTKIASDLHDEVGSMLTQISINVDSLSYTKDEEKRREKSGFIRNKCSEVINMMSDVIWSIDARNDNLESLVDRIHNFATTFLEQKEIELIFNSEIDPAQTLKIDFRQNVMMIAKEAINNAVKYSGSKKINVDIKYKNAHFELKIADNGKGIDFDTVKYGNGIKNMKMRAEAIEGKLEFLNDSGLTILFSKSKL